MGLLELEINEKKKKKMFLLEYKLLISYSVLHDTEVDTPFNDEISFF